MTTPLHRYYSKLEVSFADKFDCCKEHWKLPTRCPYRIKFGTISTPLSL